jgi:hypothetical protein
MLFWQETPGGITRFGAFHEHIGCTPCDAFYESEVRRGPWVAAPIARAVRSISFARPNCTCQEFDVSTLEVDGMAAAQFRTGPGTRPPA